MGDISGKYGRSGGIRTLCDVKVFSVQFGLLIVKILILFE